MSVAPEKPVVPVLLREGEEPDDLFALFPTLPGSRNEDTCACFDYLAGACGAHYHGSMEASKPAKEPEAFYLKQMLERAGYHFRVVMYASQEMHEKRRKATKVIYGE